MPKAAAMPTTTDTVMVTLTDSGVCRLMTWLSPNFPVGAFAYSHGLEYAVEAGEVHDADSLAVWVDGILRFGAGRVDAALFRSAYDAARFNDEARLAWTVERADAQRGTSELALESAAQGRAFLQTLFRVWPDARLRRWAVDLEIAGREPAYPVVVGVACALAEIPIRPALAAYLNAFAANLVSAVVRLVPLGQTDGQLCIAVLEDTIRSAVDAALERARDDLGSAAVTADWMSMKHETQYTRLFRS